MNGGRAATIAVCMVFAAGGGYGLGVATAPQPAVAQGPDTIDLDVYTRLDALEARADALEAGRGTVTAPFRVLDANGGVLASITGSSNTPELKLGSGIVLDYFENEPRVRISSPDGRAAGMDLRRNAATVFALQNGTDGFQAGWDPRHGYNARILQGGQAAVDMGVPPGRGAGVRFFTGGTLIAGLGIGTGGDGSLIVGYSDGSAAVSASGDGGHAEVSVHQGGRVAASMNTSDMGDGSGLVVVRNSGGVPVVYLSEGAGGGGIVSTTDSGGNEAFGAGFDGSQGIACVRRENGNQFCLEPVMPLTRVQ